MVVKVLDFGIAKVAAQALGTATSAMGTPLWMAPEQTEQNAHVSPATDVWALALLVFWALTGRNYWRTAQSGTGSVPQLMREVLFEPLVPASLRARELDPSLTLPADFDNWFARCMAREPGARFPNASAAGVELFSNVLGVSAATGLATLPSTFLPQTAPAYSAPSVGAPVGAPMTPEPSFGTITATPVATGARQSNAGKIALAVGGLVLLLGVGLVAVLGVGGLYWFTASEEPPPSAPAPVPTPVAADPGEPSSITTDPTVATPSLPHAPSPTANKPAPATADTSTAPTPSATATETPKPKALYSPGQKVDVLWGGNWWQGQVVAVKNDKYLVHYNGWAASWDEWVTTARLRGWTGSARSK